MKFKYVMFDTPNGSTPIIFPDHLQHTEIVQTFQSDYYKPVSAGFVTMPGAKVYGKSVGLGLNSREIDTAIINRDD